MPQRDTVTPYHNGFDATLQMPLSSFEHLLFLFSNGPTTRGRAGVNDATILLVTIEFDSKAMQAAQARRRLNET